MSHAAIAIFAAEFKRPLREGELVDDAPTLLFWLHKENDATTISIFDVLMVALPICINKDNIDLRLTANDFDRLDDRSRGGSFAPSEPGA